MISRSLPNPENVTSNSTLDDGYPGNIICATVSDNYFYPQHEGPFGLFCNYGGEAVYHVNRKKYTVADNSFFILNNGSRVAIDIKPENRMEAFYLFFPYNLPGQVLTGVLNSHEDLLDDPDINSAFHFNFIERLYPYNDLMQTHLSQIRSYITSVPKPDENRTDEMLALLLQELLHLNIETHRETNRIRAAKKSTRVEIYRRLYRAKEYIDQNYSLSLSLDTLARETNFHPHHFLRMFKQLFHITPHQYLTRVRLDNARRLLLTTQQPINEICENIGFESFSSFSALFKTTFDLSPLQFRNRRS